MSRWFRFRGWRFILDAGKHTVTAAKYALGDESNAIGCHIPNLGEKLYEAEPDAPFTIRCVREVGYCFEINSE